MKWIKFVFAIMVLFNSSWITGSADAAATPGSSVVNNYYGGSAFAPADRYPEMIDYPYVTEKGMYTMVYWISDNMDGSHSLNISTAKNNKWLYKAKMVFRFDENFTNIAYSHNYVFYKDGESVSALVINMEDGAISKQLKLAPGGPKESREHYVFKTVETKDRGGILYGESDGETYRIFLENELSQPLTITDPDHAISSEVAREPSVVLASARDQIIFTGSSRTSVFSIKEQRLVQVHSAGDVEVSGYFGESGDVKFYVDGRFYVWSAGANKYEYFKIYDENFKYIRTQRFKLDKPRYMFSYNITLSKSTLHVWDINYGELNTLKLESFVLDGK
ncbi:hypothetical protein [Paenibacillus typhae]|uniref:hypothetical protein n=1 Tax=Paenibacillus typhae TaxID=1174501 RepID=UPI001C8EF97D|nr:hypothetical protein [Paenibacillus typhae]MBY0008903.1 hypothetical protein [Paenibacillus typhae]